VLKAYLRDLARWADDPMTQSVMAGLIVWLGFEAMAAHQRKIAAHGRHLRIHGERLADLERDLSRLDGRTVSLLTDQQLVAGA
jgi:hypothetical protein